MRRGLSHPDRPQSEPGAISVSELTRTIKSLLENRLGTVSVSGETASLKTSPSGHVYFSLKDAYALIDCVIWRSAAARLGKLPPDGAKIVARGKLSVYEPRGRYQLVVTSISLEREKGDLWKQFELLKQKLADEGLFERDRKKPLPAEPRTIGIVTSPSGAALRDMLTILKRRAPNLRIVLAPALVQGPEAPGDVARALRGLDRWGGADVIIVGRGGGSLEDLWAFNEENLARTIAALKTPVVSAVGHETDFSIADFVADARAATPSEAAELIAPDQTHLRARLRHAAATLSRSLSGLLREREGALRLVAERSVYRRPEELFQVRWQRLDVAAESLAGAVRERLRSGGNRRDLLAARLGGVNPLAVLRRGYAVVLNARGEAARGAEDVEAGETITAILHRAEISARVDAVRGRSLD